MPRYTYCCEECDNYYDITHAMTDQAEPQCIQCGDSLIRVPSTILPSKSRQVDTKTGEVVKSSIEEFRRDLRDQRAEASKKEI